MCDKSRNTWLCVHWHWNTLEWCQLNALQASPVVHLVTPLSCVSLSMNTQPSVPAIITVMKCSCFTVININMNYHYCFIAFHIQSSNIRYIYIYIYIYVCVCHIGQCYILALSYIHIWCLGPLLAFWTVYRSEKIKLTKMLFFTCQWYKTFDIRVLS